MISIGCNIDARDSCIVASFARADLAWISAALQFVPGPVTRSLGTNWRAAEIQARADYGNTSVDTRTILPVIGVTANPRGMLREGERGGSLDLHVSVYDLGGTVTWGLFIWARLTGLARLSEISLSHYFLCKNSIVFIWELGQPGQRRSRSRRPRSRLTGLIWTLQPGGWPGWKYFNCAWLNGRLAASVAAFWLICWISHFKSMPFNCPVDRASPVNLFTSDHRVQMNWAGFSSRCPI